MKTIVLLLSLSLVFCVDMEFSVLAQLNEKLGPIKETNTGKFIMNLATIHSELRGPLGNL